MSEFIQVVSTVEKKEDAEQIARKLLETRLAACIQVVGPVKSFYRWQGKVENSQEFQVQIKCQADDFSLVEQMIKAIHPYELPEIIAIPISHHSEEYQQWLKKECSR